MDRRVEATRPRTVGGALYPSASGAYRGNTDAAAIATLPPAGNSSAAQLRAGSTVSGEQVVYVVQVGDSLLGIASRYNVSIDAVVEANNLANPDFVFSGQRLVIPVSADAAATVEAASATRQATSAGPRISAIEAAGTLANEAVLIVNESNTPVNLRGWQLERAGGPSYTFGDVQLFAGSSIRVYSTSGEDNTIALFWTQPASVWSTGATARLVDVAGREAHTVPVP